MVMDIWRPRRGVAPWRPMRDLEEFERRFEDIFGSSWPTLWPGLREGKGWMPSIDVYEKDNKVILKAELPGMKEEDIDVSVDGDMLNIKGEKNTESEVKEENYYQRESSYGSFFRSIPIPSSIDASKISADYEDGVLQVTMPKIDGVKPKKVPVSAKKKVTAKATTTKKKTAK